MAGDTNVIPARGMAMVAVHIHLCWAVWGQVLTLPFTACVNSNQMFDNTASAFPRS